MIPTDSSAVTPKSGSVPGAAKITRPAVVSPMNSIRTRPKGYSLTVPSDNSYAVFPSCLIPSFSSSSDGAIESVAPVSTRKSDSKDFCESTKLVSLVVTFVNPIPPGKYHRGQLTAMVTIPATGSNFFCASAHHCTVTACTTMLSTSPEWKNKGTKHTVGCSVRCPQRIPNGCS